MTQEEKELLLRDLCARLPYGVVIQEKCLEHNETFFPYAEDNKVVNIDANEDLVITNGGSRYYIEDIKPYLLPLSNMTVEQKTSHNFLKHSAYANPINLIDWYVKNHFDYRGLIEKGLAIDATGQNVY